MSDNLIYSDVQCEESILKIKEELGMDILPRISRESWTVNDAMSVITIPNLKMAVVNVIDEISVMEMALLHFMCKPILVTAKSIVNYPVLERKVVDFIDVNCNLNDKDNNFISWYRERYLEEING